jgi:hypothetical protein
MQPNDPWGQPQGGPQGPPAGWGPQPGYGPPPQQWGPPAAPQQQGWGQPPAQQAPAAAQRAVTPPDPDELMSGGHRSAVFPDQQYGTVVGGRIIEKPVTTQQRDFDSGQPKFYDDGNPMWQVVVAVQAQPATDEDDGVRAFYIKSQMKKAVQDAVRRAGAERLEVGGTLQVRYERDEPNSRGRGKDKKIYAARYTPPAGQAAPPTSPAAQASASQGIRDTDVSRMASAPPQQASAFDSEPPF